MARPGLRIHPKFLRLCMILREPAPHILGHLEYLWETAYEAGNPEIGDSVAVELSAGWDGEPGALFAALCEAGGDGRVGFIEPVDGHQGRWQIHDLFDHAPQYVQRRMTRESQRKANGYTLSEIRSIAGSKGGKTPKNKQLTSRELSDSSNGAKESSKQTEANDSPPAPAPTPNNPYSPLDDDGGFKLSSGEGDGGKAKPKKKPIKAKPKKKPMEYSPEFQEFWDHFPPIRKKAKPKAWVAWTTAIQTVAPSVIIDAAKAFAASPEGRCRFCPGPEPWLHQCRWEDDRRAWERYGQDDMIENVQEVPYKQY